ncbi:MAG: PaaI family thioesterase [Sphingobium sp.]
MADMISGDRVPAGFRLLSFADDGFIGRNGPIYLDRTGPEPLFGFPIGAQHCNPMGICHGGWVASMMDMILPLTARFAVPDLADHFLLTINMTIDYLGSPAAGDWVEGRAQILKRTGRMVFAQGLLSVDGVAVARGNGVFRIGPKAPLVEQLTQ